MNLLTETIDFMDYCEKSTGDITFIGSYDGEYSCTFEEYEVLADFEYYDGFGAQNVASDLVILFSDSSVMSRSEYDGSECWELTTPVNVPDKTKNITTLCNGGMWDSIATMNSGV